MFGIFLKISSQFEYLKFNFEKKKSLKRGKGLYLNCLSFWLQCHVIQPWIAVQSVTGDQLFVI